MEETIVLKDQFTSTIINATRETIRFRDEVDSLTKSVSGLLTQLRLLKKQNISVQIKVKDNATEKIKNVKKDLNNLERSATTPIIKVKDSATNIIDKVKKDLTSLEKTEIKPVIKPTLIRGLLSKIKNEAPSVSQGASNLGGLGGLAGPALTGITAIGKVIFNLYAAGIKTTIRVALAGIKLITNGLRYVMSLPDKAFGGGAGKLKNISGKIKGQFMKVGQGIFKSINPWLDKINGWFDKNQAKLGKWRSNLIKIGRQISEKLFSGMETAFNYIQANYLDNPKLKGLTLSGKIEFIMGDLKKQFDKWYKNGGKEKIEEFGTALGDILRPIGQVVGEAFATGFTSVFSSIFSFSDSKYNIWSGNKKDEGKKDDKQGGVTLTKTSYASGLRYVPYDNYPALLHRGEAVLPRRNADHYRNGGRASNIIISKLADTINASNPRDVDSLLDKLEVRLLQTAANMGSV